MRLHRHSWLAAVAAIAACESDAIVNQITRDGAGNIPVIDLSTSNAGGFLGGSRATNRFLAVGQFDTSFADAFARSSARLANLVTDAGCYGTDSLIRPFTGNPATYTAPGRLLPAVVGTARTRTGGGCPNPLARIVPAGNTGNGAGNTVWEVWYQFEQLTPVTRYVMGFARYRLQVRGALDESEVMLTGAVAQPDSLVFDAFAPGGKTSADVFTTSCASANIIQPTAGANPHLLGSDLTDATGAVDLDQTVCANAAANWGARYTAKSPVPRNNATTIGASQYNFFVVWEALPDSTPDYSKPVWREQIGPVFDLAGNPINNGYGPFPPAQLTPAQLALLPATAAQADTIRVTATNIVPLTGAVYSFWVRDNTGGTTTKVTGRVVRLNGAAVVDTLVGVSEFNLLPTMNSARVEFDYATVAPVAYDRAILAVAAPGAATLPAAQPLWTSMATQKAKGGAVPSLSSNLTHGSFNAGSAPVIFGAAGTATGGIFGTELREDVLRLARPPVGYMYDAWLVSTVDTTLRYRIGTLFSPHPELAPLTDADVQQTAPLSGVELTRSALRFLMPSTTFHCTYNRVQVRLAPKATTGTLPPTIILSGTLPTTGC